jgi:hypothetical protein
MCAALMKTLTDAMGTTPVALLFVLITWSIFLTGVYLIARIIAIRAMPFTMTPLVVLPFQLVGDLFSEILLADFELTDWPFWVSETYKLSFVYLSQTDFSFVQVILFFDVFLLVMRDADLWDDFAVWIRKTFGRLGSMVILAAQLAEGDSGDEIGDCIFKNTKAPNLANFQPPSKLEEARVKRELTESECIYSTDMDDVNVNVPYP